VLSANVKFAAIAQNCNHHSMRNEPLYGITTKDLELLFSDARGVATRRAWAEWGPKTAQMARAPLYLFAVEHHEAESCSDPAVPAGGQVFMNAFAVSPMASGWNRPMPLLPLPMQACSTCLKELQLVPKSIFVLWPDGVIQAAGDYRLVTGPTDD
jgi:hypothetical protein